MATKRVKAEIQPDVDDDGCIVLRGALFWEWRALVEQMQRIDSDLKLRSHEVDKALDEHPALRTLLNERAALVHASGTSRIEYQHVLARLEEHFGFPMKNVSIDDQTGRVHTVNGPDDTAPTPKKLSKTKPKTRK